MFLLARTVPLSQAVASFWVSLHPVLTHLTFHHFEPEVHLSSEGLVRYVCPGSLCIPSEELQRRKKEGQVMIVAIVLQRILQ